MDPFRLHSECDVRTARERHAELIDAFLDRNEVEIDAGGVEHADVTLIQLLISAARTAEASQKRMRILSISEPLRSVLARAGLRLSPSDEIHWARGF